MHTSSSVFSSKSGRLPHSNTFTPGGKKVRQARKKAEKVFLDCDLRFQVALVSLFRGNNYSDCCKTWSITFMLNTPRLFPTLLAK